MNLDANREVRFPNRRQELSRCFNGPLCPAELLGLQGIDLCRQLGRGGDIVEISEFSPAQLRTITEIEILGEGISMPVAGVLNCLLAPNAAGPVEIDEVAGLIPDILLDHKVAVKRHCLRAGQKRVFAVEMFPAGLDNADLRVLLEVGNRLLQELSPRNKISVENSNKFSPSRLQTIE